MSVEAHASWSLPETFLFEGQAVRFGTLGRADSPPLVLVHGTPFSSVVWRRIAPHLTRYRQVLYYGSIEKRVGYAATQGLMLEKSSLPSIMKMTVRMVLKRPYPRALRLAAWKSPLIASRKPLVWREWTQERMPSK